MQTRICGRILRRLLFTLFVLILCARNLCAEHATPRLLLTADDFGRINRLAQSANWASSVRTSIVQSAESWPLAYRRRYGLPEWRLPPEGGQWSAWYICPKHGIPLEFRGPGQNICPLDGQNYTGWPYDQVIYTRRHMDLASSARDNGLAYRLTGNVGFALSAGQILSAYADIYSTYPVHYVNSRTDTNNGARAHAQTLDEAVWLISLAWAYDLVADSGALNAEQRLHIEQNLLRAAVTVILRNSAGMSNWQSWHNATIGAVGFALGDNSLVEKAINDPKNGFRYQMRESVLGDGMV